MGIIDWIVLLAMIPVFVISGAVIIGMVVFAFLINVSLIQEMFGSKRKRKCI